MLALYFGQPFYIREIINKHLAKCHTNLIGIVNQEPRLSSELSLDVKKGKFGGDSNADYIMFRESKHVRFLNWTDPFEEEERSKNQRKKTKKPEEKMKEMKEQLKGLFFPERKTQRCVRQD